MSIEDPFNSAESSPSEEALLASQNGGEGTESIEAGHQQPEVLPAELRNTEMDSIHVVEEIPKGVELKSGGSYGIFERLYKSKSARAITFAAALFGAGIGLKQQAEHGREMAKSEAEVAEMLKTDEMRLEGLADKFKIEVQVPGGESTILHIGQTHAMSTDTGEYSLEVMQAAGVDKDIIDSQKKIYSLLEFLAEKNISNTVYLEGSAAGELKSFNSQRKIGEKYLKSGDVLTGLAEISEFAKNLDLGRTGEDTFRAQELYSAKCELEREIKKMESEYEKFLTTGNADEDYKKVFESAIENKADFQKTIEGTKSVISKISKNELIEGEKIYLWGAAEKLSIDRGGKGNIDLELKPVESAEAYAKTVEPPLTFVENLKASALRDEQTSKAVVRHRLREDAAINIIAEDQASRNKQERIIPIMYGRGHEFADSTEEFNKNAGQKRFGLTKIAPTRLPGSKLR